VSGLARTVGRLPSPAAAWLGRRLGELGWAIFGQRRRLALANLARAFPEVPEPERRRLCRECWRHLGVTAVELCQLLVRPAEQLLARVTIEGREHLDAVMAHHGRALVLSAHLGNWEVLAAASRLVGYRLAVVARPLDRPGLERLAREIRRRAGVEVIAKRDALGAVLAALRRGAMVGILLDQNAVRREGVFVPFFGHLASTSRALAVLALRTRTPVVPIFAYRRPGGGHRVVVHPAIDPGARATGPEPSGPRALRSEAAIVELTAQCTRAVEAAIREHPEQWLWIHDRWRTRPAAGA